MTENQEGFNQARFHQAIALFDAANSEDPNLDEGQPKELLYSQRMSDMIARFAPEASEAAQLAVRAQHIFPIPGTSCRIPTTLSRFPCGSTSSHRMRTDLSR